MRQLPRLTGVVVLVALVFAAPTRAQAPKDLVDVAVAAGSFKTLVAAVQAAGLVEVLKRPGPLTVLAPTDEALLTGNVSAADLKMMKDFGTAQGQRIQLSSSGGVLKINNATVVKPDVAAANGVIHVIDTVLLPK